MTYGTCVSCGRDFSEPCDPCLQGLVSDLFSGVDDRHPEPVGVDPYEAKREPQKPSWELER